MRMKIFAEIRHGDYGDNFRLSELGRLHLRELAEKLNPLVGHLCAIVFTSSAVRASESANFLASTLKTANISVEECEHLQFDHERAGNTKKSAERLLELSEKYDAVIVVTHLELVGGLYPYFAEKYLHKEIFLPPRDDDSVRCGHGYLHDIERNTCSTV
ncbi:MAG: hypothetical protein AAB428_02755 [Patescibacteria group bacterium]